MTDPWTAQMEALGAYIRSQRELAHLSLRQMAELTRLSHPYLSQVERGVHQPSVRVLKAISEALNLSAETLLAQAGLFSGEEPAAAGDDPKTPTAQQVADVIKADPRLTEAQKAALIAVYASMLRDDETAAGTTDER
ncbi:MAG TPA: helix-turn-helix transcriptional regulator [Streptosporangiaceae bacterium]